MCFVCSALEGSLRNGESQPPHYSSRLNCSSCGTPSSQHLEVCPKTSRSHLAEEMTELHSEYSDSSCGESVVSAQSLDRLGAWTWTARNQCKSISPAQKTAHSSATNATPSLRRRKRWSSTCFRCTATSRTSVTAARLLSATRATLPVTRLFIQVPLKGPVATRLPFHSFAAELSNVSSCVCLCVYRREALSL